MMFDALIVDPSSRSRSNLKQVAHFGELYRRVFTSSSLQEALLQLQDQNKGFDVVFISGALGDAQVRHFVEQAKQLPAGSDTAYIVVRPLTDNDPLQMAENLMKGTDGFLVEPFSVEAVCETAKIAAKVKRQNAERRMTAASGLVVASMIDAIDHRAEELQSGTRPRPFSAQMKTASKQFKSMAGDAWKAFVDSLIDQTSRAAPRKERGYLGASTILKERLRRKKKKK